MIEAKGVTKSYGFGESKADILKGIDLQISDGDFAVILGASGSGKSTLLNCLSGLERVDGGSIEYDGLNIAELSDKALTKFRKENIGFIFQQYIYSNLLFYLLLFADFYVKREFSFRKWVKNLKGGKTFWKQVIVTTVFFLIVFGLTTALESFFPNLDTGMIMLKRDTPARLIAFAISTMFLPAITEESFYRKSIISFRSKPALVLSAVFGMLLYAAEHSLKPWGIFLTAIWALPLTISYIRTKNVYVPMTAHFIVNVFGNGVTVIMTIVAVCK